jgi:predicted ArsR family transcriptional regulator
VEAALHDAARATGEEIGAAIRTELRPSRSARATRAAALRALEQLGYEPHERGRDVVLVNCPFHALAERHRGLVCGMNLDLITGIAHGLGAAARLAPRLDPEPGLCCVRLAAG